MSEEEINKLEKCMEITEKALKKSEPKDEKGEKLLKFVENYYKDAEHYKSKKDRETALEAVSYAHGILDAGVLTKHIKTPNYLLNPEEENKK